MVDSGTFCSLQFGSNKSNNNKTSGEKSVMWFYYLFVWSRCWIAHFSHGIQGIFGIGNEIHMQKRFFFTLQQMEKSKITMGFGGELLTCSLLAWNFFVCSLKIFVYSFSAVAGIKSKPLILGALVCAKVMNNVGQSIVATHIVFRWCSSCHTLLGINDLNASTNIKSILFIWLFLITIMH